MKTTISKSGGNGLTGALDFLFGAGALLRAREELVDELVIVQPAKSVVVAVVNEQSIWSGRAMHRSIRTCVLFQ